MVLAPLIIGTESPPHFSKTTQLIKLRLGRYFVQYEQALALSVLQPLGSPRGPRHDSLCRDVPAHPSAAPNYLTKEMVIANGGKNVV